MTTSSHPDAPAQLLVDTPWETRNIGRASYELTEAATANAEATGRALGAAVHERGAIFVHARVGRKRLACVPALQPLGFYVVECSIEPVMHLNHNEGVQRFAREPAAFVPRRFQGRALGLAQLVRGHRADEDIVRTIAAESFVDDRFHNDHQCPPAVAERRYRYWVDDMLAAPDVVFHLLQLEGQPIAFFAQRRDHLILLGFARAHAAEGLGEYFCYAVCRYAQDAGHTVLHSRISCNNLPALNMCVRMGFKFRGTAYSLHCWR
jgi:hypothetical protein